MNKAKRGMSKIIREQQRKIAEERRKRKEEENATLHKSSTPDLINSKPNPSLSHSPSVPALVEKRENKRQEKDKECVTNYYLPSPIYIPSYGEYTPILVDNLNTRANPRRGEKKIDASRQIKTKDKPAEEDEQAINKEKKEEKKETE